MKRDSGIELYRCLLTLGIVFIHVVGQYASEYHWLSSSLMWCVDGFVFISGYFGIRFSYNKLIRLVVDVLIVLSISSLAIGWSCGEWGPLANIWRGFLFNWFIVSYLVLMLCVPMLNAALEKSCMTAVPFLLLAFGWSYFASFNFTSSVFPGFVGAGSYTPLTLGGIYVTGRLYRRFEIEKILDKRLALICFCLLWGMATTKVSQYNSPMAVVQAAMGFRLFQGLKMSAFVEGTLTLISPSMLAVFVGHANPWTLPKLKVWVDVIYNSVGCVYSAFFIVGFMVFVCAIFLDVPRRVMGRLMRGVPNLSSPVSPSFPKEEKK